MTITVTTEHIDTSPPRKPRVESVVPLRKDPRHGYATTPRSRAYWCAQTPGAGCGPISSEPQSVEGPKGFPEAGPADGQLASGGNTRFAVLDSPRAPSGQPWPATALTAGAAIRFRWWLTAAHRTSRWQYWITRDGWDQSAPLTRAQLEPRPFATIEWPCPGDEAWRCYTPISDVHHLGYLPKGKTGRHVIYAVWVVADTGNAFYQAIDVDFTSELTAGAEEDDDGG